MNRRWPRPSASPAEATTGTRWALTSSLLERYLPTGGEGLLPRNILPDLLQSRLLRSYNVRYVLVHEEDAPLRGFLDAVPSWRLHRKVGSTLVYACDDALERAYFATDVYPGDDVSGLIRNTLPPRSVLVMGLASSAELPPAKVLNAQWSDNHVSMNVDAPQGGRLVIAMSFNQQWRALEDSKPTRIERTNGTIMSVALSPGAQHVELHYDDMPLRIGLLWATVGAVLLGVMLLWAKPKTASNPPR